MVRNPIILLLAVFMCTLVEDYVEGCSCMPVHPQKQFCDADFVIVARIKKMYVNDMNMVYKARIKKEFKMSEKARVALKAGKITTARDGAMCGVHLEEGKIYVITGAIYGLQARINLCGFQRQWKDVTSRQRKGFRLIYGRGCDCKITSNVYGRGYKDGCGCNDCKCHEDYGICLRSPSGKCNWAKSLELKQCLNGEPITRFRKIVGIANEPQRPLASDPVIKNEIQFLRNRRSEEVKIS